MRTTFLSTLAMAFAINASADPAIDLGLFPGPGNDLEIRLRPNTIVDGIVSSIVFTLRWDVRSGTSPGALTQKDPVMAFLPIRPSGGVITHDGYNYQVFAGFGMIAMKDLNVEMRPGEEFVIATVPVVGNGTFELVNDDWTSKIDHNADLYVSVAGIDRTGIIYHKSASLDAAAAGHVLSIQPNPTTGEFDLMLDPSTDGPVQITLVNTLGQVILSEQVADGAALPRHFDLTGQARGSYYIEVSNGARSERQTVVLQ